MLGDGHTVCFYASNEVHNMLVKISPTQIGSFEIIKWAINNTISQTIDNFMNWAIQGLYFLKRESIYKKFQRDSNLHEYAKNCAEKEILELRSLYEADRVEHLILNLVKQKADTLSKFINQTNSQEIVQIVEFYVKNKKKFSQLLDEEREMEFQVEQEEEHEVYRPIANEALVNMLEDDVIHFANTGIIKEKSKSFLNLSDSLMNSSISAELMQAKAWSSLISVTRDFCKTVKTLNGGDDFLRMPRWIALSNKSNKVLILSSYEANKLYAKFKSNGHVSLSMLLPRIKKKQERIIHFSSDFTFSGNLLEQISIFAGSMYLDSEEEQDEYLLFLGYCPRPRTEEQEKFAYDRKILKNGYVPIEFREEVFQSMLKDGQTVSKFDDEPSTLVQNIISFRNYGLVPNSAHHNILFKSDLRPLNE